MHCKNKTFFIYYNDGRLSSDPSEKLCIWQFYDEQSQELFAGVDTHILDTKANICTFKIFAKRTMLKDSVVKVFYFKLFP